MIALIFLALNLLAALVKSKSRLEAENAALRQQLIVLRKVRGRVRFSKDDRLFFVQLYRWHCHSNAGLVRTERCLPRSFSISVNPASCARKMGSGAGLSSRSPCVTVNRPAGLLNSMSYGC
jgi:hypothetical protein